MYDYLLVGFGLCGAIFIRKAYDRMHWPLTR